MQNVESEAKPDGLPIVSIDELKAADISGPIKDSRKSDCRDFEWAYARAAEMAQTAGQEPTARVFRLMAALCSFHFRVEDPAGPYGPDGVRGNRRTAIPDDFRGEQSRILEAFIPDIAHPGLRARVADTVWLNDRSRAVAANAAIDAYCEATEGLTQGIYSARFEHKLQGDSEKADLIRRALQIASQIGKKGQVPDRVKKNARLLYETAKTESEWVPFERIGRMHLDYRLDDASAVATDAEALAAAAGDLPKFPLAVKRVWDLAADAYARAKDEQSSRRCRLKGVDQTLAMCQQVPMAGAQASWVRTAIEELRHISGTTERREELRRELLLLQERALDDFRSISTPIDVDDIRADMSAAFDAIPLSDALLKLAALTGSRPVAELRAEAIRGVEGSPLSAMFSSVHTDHEGKYVAEAPAISLSDGKPDEDAVKAAMSQNQRIWRQFLVAGYIDPAREAIGRKYSVSERHFSELAFMSPFVPATHAYAYALGFARFMQGDFVSAAHLLVPQVEHSIRHVLRSAGVDSSKIMPDMLQEDRPLSALLDEFRPQLEAMFGQDIVNEIELLFVYRPGPALRHEFAHGKVGAGGCLHPDTIYGCWFIYRLVCLPLFPYWQKHVSPMIDV